jgi:D-inositol-3-phosphate glycosyltransferase
MKKRVLYVLDYFHPHRWGVETVFGHIAGHFGDMYDVTVLTSYYDRNLEQYEKIDNIDVVRVCGWRLMFMLFGWFFGLLYFIKNKARFDLIHTSTYGGALSGRILSVLWRIPSILTVHEVFGRLWIRYKWRWRGLLYWFAEFLIFCLPFDYYHSVSLSTFNAVRLMYGIKDTRHCMIYNGVDHAFWHPGAVSEQEKIALRHKLNWNDRYVILYYGHSGMSKWLDLLVEAIPALCEKYPDILIVFNLIPAKRDTYIRNYIHAQGHSHNVHVYDGFSLHDLRTLVAASDVVVAPSLSEWFGSVHAEVSALWQNLITTHYASIPEVVFGKIFFLPSRDVDALVDGIYRMRSNTIEVTPTKHFDWALSFEQFAQLYTLFM